MCLRQRIQRFPEDFEHLAVMQFVVKRRRFRRKNSFVDFALHLARSALILLKYDVARDSVEIALWKIEPFALLGVKRARQRFLQYIVHIRRLHRKPQQDTHKNVLISEERPYNSIFNFSHAWRYVSGCDGLRKI